MQQIDSIAAVFCFASPVPSFRRRFAMQCDTMRASETSLRCAVVVVVVAPCRLEDERSGKYLESSSTNEAHAPPPRPPQIPSASPRLVRAMYVLAAAPCPAIINDLLSAYSAGDDHPPKRGISVEQDHAAARQGPPQDIPQAAPDGEEVSRVCAPGARMVERKKRELDHVLHACNSASHRTRGAIVF